MKHSALREQIIALELGRSERQVLPFGLPDIDEALQGGIDLGAMHEISGPAAVLFTQVIIRQKGEEVAWLSMENLNEEYYPYGLLQSETDPARFIVVRSQNSRDLLKAAYEVLASNAVGCVLLEVQEALTQTQMRKLQIAVKNTRTLGLILNTDYTGSAAPESKGLLGSALTRWYVQVLHWTYETTQIELYLTKNRHGSPCHWIVEIDHATHHLHLVPISGKRAIDQAESRTVAEALCPDHP
ncbi:MAG: hypothetical protein CMN56_00690 [Sneathiella sp.]|uniref:ImuA family protein n=1 Tax=Sneathiella sp. TaxID=1964365 RepID=UPI000C3ED168|nr:hypothetical protein [Sneathiella sp.]MAZ01636.1 hypothetical protein [Sneathiella sp.]